MAGLSPSFAAGSLSDVVLVSNRGPLAFRNEQGQCEPGPLGGGLAGALLPLVEDSGATWVACALSPADRQAIGEGRFTMPGIRLAPVLPDPVTYDMAYNVVANATLWFCHHHLFDASRRPQSDHRWLEAWDAFRSVNTDVAHQVAEVAPEGGRVLVQDYHLPLVAAPLRTLRPDLRTVHFSHTPFADPSVLRMLPTPVGVELLDGLHAAHACGFHSHRWAAAFRACRAELTPQSGEGRTFVSPLSVDPIRLATAAEDPRVAAAAQRLEETIGDPRRKVIVRVDRMELSKNLLRGFWAFDELLQRSPQWRGRVVFLALAYPTRQGLADYLAYQVEVETTVARLNDRWGTPEWTPVILDVDDNYPRSLAALQRYDLLLVNPIRDGLNLVAMEGPLLNRRQGVLVLSTEAGAFDLLGAGAVGLNPFDVSATAAAMERGLDMDPSERATRAATLREAVVDRPPGQWLVDQLRAAD